MFDFIPPASYFPFFLHLILLLVLIKCGRLSASDKGLFLLLTIFLILFLGNRQLSGAYFGDTSNYARNFARMKNYVYYKPGTEYVFNYLMYGFARFGLSVTDFFTFVATVYVGCSAWACQRMFKEQGYLAFLLVLGAFSFFSYGTNGIRNGMAAAVMMLALSFLENKKWLAILIALISINIHNSMMLSLFSAIVCLLYNNSKTYFYFWLFSIVLSVIAGGPISNFFLSLGIVEDARLTNYIAGTTADQFSSTGFRWDFLMYSCIPILIGFYYTAKRGFEDKTYQFILNTYILSNSFWVMVIRANYSNRFAYLSWFLYGIVLIYPLLKCEDVPGRIDKIRMALFGNVAFTYVMWLMGKC